MCLETEIITHKNNIQAALESKTCLTDDLAEARAIIEAFREVCTKFCDRQDRGEVRSNVTYGEMQAVLGLIPKKRTFKDPKWDCEVTSPIHIHDGVWWFWDETWGNRPGRMDYIEGEL